MLDLSTLRTRTYAERWPDWRLAVLPAAFCVNRLLGRHDGRDEPINSVACLLAALLSRWGYLEWAAHRPDWRPTLFMRFEVPIARDQPGAARTFGLNWSLIVAGYAGRRLVDAVAADRLVDVAPDAAPGRAHGRWRHYADDDRGCMALVAWVLWQSGEDLNARPIEAFHCPGSAHETVTGRGLALARLGELLAYAGRLEIVRAAPLPCAICGALDACPSLTIRYEGADLCRSCAAAVDYGAVPRWRRELKLLHRETRRRGRLALVAGAGSARADEVLVDDGRRVTVHHPDGPAPACSLCGGDGDAFGLAVRLDGAAACLSCAARVDEAIVARVRRLRRKVPAVPLPRRRDVRALSR